MAASAEDLTFGDFSDLDLAEYQKLFKDPVQSSNVEFPWDDKSYVRSTLQNDCDGADQVRVPSQRTPVRADQLVMSSDIRVQQDAVCSGKHAPNPHYYLPNKPAGMPANQHVESLQSAWSNQPSVDTAAVQGSVFTDALERSSDGATGNDSQNEDGTGKRRNKKRRDPDHYKQYYCNVETEGSFDNESSTENGTSGLKTDESYSGNENDIPPVVPASRCDYNVGTTTASPGSRYSADEPSTERTSVYGQAITADPSANSITQTVDSCIVHTRPEKSFESSTPEDVSKQLLALNVTKGNIDDEAAFSNPQPTSPNTASNSQAVPVVHISHSDSTRSTSAVTAGAPLASPPTAPPAVKSWASLFKGGAGGGSGTMSHAPVAINITTDSSADGGVANGGAVALVSTDKDPHAKKLGEHLSRERASHHPMNLQPRGLINTANWCYINSILQALLSCPPLYHLIKNLPFNNKLRKASSTPMLDAMYQFLKEFQELKGLSRRSSQDIRPGMAFEPTIIYQMLSVAQTSLAVKQGRQEDAEEFLSCLLNGLHDEMTSLIQSANGEDEDEDDKLNGLPVAVANGDVGHEGQARGCEEEDEWEQVGPRNKTSITRKAQFATSPLSHIFGGIMRSALHQHGSKESATLQPFFSLQLDVQSQEIWTVQNALDALGNKESVHGFMSNKTKKEVEAFRRITLEELPPVLILHLKRFLYDKSGGCQKLMKKVEYGVELEISKDLISPNAKSRISFNQRNYKLFAVVYHTGKEASGGHYITDVYHVGTSGWVRCDDGIVKPVKAAQVTKPMSTYIPYLLFYRRRDLLTKP